MGDRRFAEPPCRRHAWTSAIEDRYSPRGNRSPWEPVIATNQPGRPIEAAFDPVAESLPVGSGLTIATVIVLIGIFGASQGLCYPLFSLILQHQGVDSGLIGLNSAMMPVGMIAFAPLLPAATRRFGSAAVGLSCTVLLMVSLGLMGLVQNVWFWFPVRFLLGLGISGLYVTSEIWINVMGSPLRRGQRLGLFASALSLGVAGGPFLIIVTGTSGWPPFLTAMSIMSVAILLLLLVFRRLPDVGTERGGSLRAFLPLAPRLLAIVGLMSAFDQAMLSLFPVFGTANGLGEREIAFAITVWAIGNILFQVPIGWLADRWSRRGTMALLCIVTVIGAALLPLVVRSPRLLWPMLLVWGPAAYGIYTLATVELGVRFRGSLLLAGNAAFAVMWGVGGMVGPPALGLAIDRFGPDGLPAGLGVIYLALLACVLVPSTPRGQRARH